LNVSGNSLRRWAKEVGQPEDAVGTLRSVKLVEAASPVERAGLVVHGPSGVWVEGLDVASVAELLRRLS
jgi:transposase